MTDKLIILLEGLGFTPEQGMNLLQDHAVISDNSVWPSEVLAADSALAVAWLEEKDDIIK